MRIWRYIKINLLRLRSLNFYSKFLYKANDGDFKLPIESKNYQQDYIFRAKKYTMTSLERLWALTNSVEYVLNNNLDGDFVEVGVWKGGNLILMDLLLQHYSVTNKAIYGFDTFSGMTKPGMFDRDLHGTPVDLLLNSNEKIEGDLSIHAWASLETVINNLRANNVNKVKLIEGDVLTTLQDKSNIPKSISILRLDTDWYESTKYELEQLYPLLVTGGVLIIDDYGHYLGAKQAVDEYFKKKRPFMHYIDYTGRLIIKNE